MNSRVSPQLCDVTGLQLLLVCQIDPCALGAVSVCLGCPSNTKICLEENIYYIYKCLVSVHMEIDITSDSWNLTREEGEEARNSKE